MKTRILSACILLPLLIFVYLGGYFIIFAALVLTCLALKELNIIFSNRDVKMSLPLAYVSTALLYVMHIVLWKGVDDLSIWKDTIWIWVSFVVIASLIYGLNVEKRRIVDTMATMLSVFYVTFLFYFIVRIDEKLTEETFFFIWWIFTIAFGSDIFAYFIGSAFGKHKLCEKISPKKTIEGAIGGVLGSIILTLVFTLIFVKEAGVSIVFIVIVSLIGSILAQAGDLAASGIKRQLEVKDFGNLIPGHGGILDRFDSVLFVAPYIYFIITVFCR